MAFGRRGCAAPMLWECVALLVLFACVAISVDAAEVRASTPLHAGPDPRLQGQCGV